MKNIIEKHRKCIVIISIAVVLSVICIIMQRSRDIEKPIFLTTDSVWFVEPETTEEGDFFTVEVPLTYVDNVNRDRYIYEMTFGQNDEFHWKMDGLHFDNPTPFYQGSKWHYGKEVFFRKWYKGVFFKKYAIRREVLYCSIPREQWTGDMNKLVISEIKVHFDEHYDGVSEDMTMTVPVGECKLTFDEDKARDGIKTDFLNKFTNRAAIEMMKNGEL